MTNLTPEAVKAALEGKEPICAKCGKPRSNHQYRHPFVAVGGSKLDAMAPDLAREWLELKAENERLRGECSDLWKSRMNPYDQPPQVQTVAGFFLDDLIGFNREIRNAIDAARAALKGKTDGQT